MNAGRYQLGDVMGVGSFATVYRARDDLLEDTVVIKMLAENHSLNPEIRERFIAEGRSLRRIVSEHVVTVHDIGESSRQQPFLVLELADRGTLASRVQSLRARGWNPSANDILSLVRPLAQALEAVHTAQVVHRDLSPGNLLLASSPQAEEHQHAGPQLVRTDERLLVADLGMCKDLAINSGLTVSGGTAGFRPPEQSRPGVVDTRADIWAASALVSWVADGANLPQDFHQVLQRGMSTDPTDRQQTVTQWLAEIEESLVPPPPVAAPPPPQHDDQVNGLSDFMPEPVESKPVSMTTLLLVGLSVLTGIIGLVAGLFVSAERYPAETDGASIAISGPDEITVGEAANFTAEVEGVDSWIWALPTGTNVVDDTEATVTATEPGTNDIILRARGPDGQELEARHSVTVTE